MSPHIAPHFLQANKYLGDREYTGNCTWNWTTVRAACVENGDKPFFAGIVTAESE